MCGPVFQQFMTKAIQKYGGGQFKVPEQCQFINIDRFTGARLSDGASGNNVVAECFRQGEEPIFGIQFDGGFAMGGNFNVIQPDGSSRQVTDLVRRDGCRGPKASFGTLSSGGLY